MTQIDLEGYRRNYLSKLNDEQKLCIQTCPSFLVALALASDGLKTYDTVGCISCDPKVTVRVIPGIKKIDIKGKCPKI